MKGIVKRFNKDKGFGFISDEAGNDVFFHYSKLVMEGFKDIAEGTVVEYDIFETDKGLQAENIITKN